MTGGRIDNHRHRNNRSKFFAGTSKEQPCGFDPIECANLDEAIEIAAKHPAAAGGVIEVRPLWED
ncbi:MAG: hypothetical protein JOY82_08860 [Streptosporangiaceae bacterium]|nr:hypothetical protein [Streptosporangiaceae bacterium]MBV9854623.1 hypothetical protein [Streptosporangiaceae bacterium]